MAGVLTVGPSRSVIKNVTVPAGYCCPKIVNNSNWLGSASGPATFSLVHSEATLMATLTRIDKLNGWRQDLQILCSSNASFGNATSPVFTFTTEPILSTLDTYNDIHSMIIMLCITMLISSVLSPKTTNVVKEPYRLDDLYSDGAALGEGSIASKLFSERIGRAHAVFVSRFGMWSVLLAVLCETVNNAKFGIEAPIRGWIAASADFIFCCVWGPAQHVPTLKLLVKEASSWYYLLLLCAGGGASALILAHRVVHIHRVLHSFVYTLGLLIVLPGMDALPPALFPRRSRIAMFGFLSLLCTYAYVRDQTERICGLDCPKGESQTCLDLRVGRATHGHACFDLALTWQ